MQRAHLYRSMVLAAAMACAASVPAQAGMKVSGSLAPVPADCSTGMDFCKNGLPQSAACDVDNSVCSGGTTAKSKMSLSDRLILKFSVKGLKDNDGNLVTTNTANANDDHIMKLGTIRCLVDNGVMTNCANPRDVYVKFDVVNGNASVNTDLTPAFASDPAGTAIMITSASLRASAADPFNCTGDLAARVDNANCDSGLPYAVFGVAKKQ